MKAKALLITNEEQQQIISQLSDYWYPITGRYQCQFGYNTPRYKEPYDRFERPRGRFLYNQILPSIPLTIQTVIDRACTHFGSDMLFNHVIADGHKLVAGDPDRQLGMPKHCSYEGFSSEMFFIPLLRAVNLHFYDEMNENTKYEPQLVQRGEVLYVTGDDRWQGYHTKTPEIQGPQVVLTIRPVL